MLAALLTQSLGSTPGPQSVGGVRGPEPLFVLRLTKSFEPPPFGVNSQWVPNVPSCTMPAPQQFFCSAQMARPLRLGLQYAAYVASVPIHIQAARWVVPGGPPRSVQRSQSGHRALSRFG